MATFVNPIIDTGATVEDFKSRGRVGFLATQPQIGIEYAEYRPPGSLWAYYRATDGYVELYMADPSGYKFMGIR